MIESNIMFEGNDDEVAIHLLISLKCTVIVGDTGSPVRNTPHFTSRVFYETKVIRFQHNTEATTDHYSQ